MDSISEIFCYISQQMSTGIKRVALDMLPFSSRKELYVGSPLSFVAD